MKKQFTFLALTLAILIGTGCYRLDANLFNPDDSITEYLFEDSDQYDWDVELDESYAIGDSMIHLFQLDSKTEDETSPTKIWVEYIGDMANIATDTIILYAHGNSTNMDAYWQRTKLLANLGHKHRFGVMTFDYRGFGLSDGTPTEEGMYADFQACAEWLRQNGLTSDRLIYYGFSLGSAPATELTAHPQTISPSWLILEAPFASAEVMAQDGTGLAIPGSFFTNIKIDNAEEIKLVQQPFMWIHGIEDNFLTFENHGQVVWDNYAGIRGTKLSVPGSGHSGVAKTMGAAPYSKAVLDFILDQ